MFAETSQPPAIAEVPSHMMETEHELSPDNADIDTVTNRLKVIFSQALRTETVIQVFGPYVAAATDTRETQAQICAQRFRDLYERLPETAVNDTSSLSSDRIEVIKWLCEYVYSISSPRYISLIFHILAVMVRTESFRSSQNQFSDIDLKVLSAQLLESQELSIKRPHHWTAVFNLIGEIIEIVNYKAIQKILISIVYKLPKIPANSAVNRREIQALARVMNRLLDREANLLPAYMSLNEIRQKLTEGPPCWALSQKIAQLESSFRPLAEMITIQSKECFLPLVQYNHPNIKNPLHWHIWLNWHIDPEKLTWKSTHIAKIPFHHSQYEKQYRLLYYVLSHRYSYDMLLTIMSLSQTRSVSTRPNQLSQFVIQYLMDVITSDSTNAKGRQVNWQNLQVPMVQMLVHNHLKFGDTLRALRIELAKGTVPHKKIIQSRDALMWLLLQYMSAMLPKINNPMSEFAPFIELFNELYGDTAFNSLPVPGKTSLEFIPGYAALCILMHFKRAAANAEGEGTVYIPGCLKEQHRQLKELVDGMNSLTFEDYRLVLLINVFSPNAQQEYNQPFDRVIACLTGETVTELPGSTPTAPVQAHSCIVPMTVDMLDSITMRGKMEVSTKVLSQLFVESRGQSVHPSPALVHTYTRFLVYTEIEVLIFRPLTASRSSTNSSQTKLPLLQECIQGGHLAQLHIMVEILRYRLHHVDIATVHQALNILLTCLNTLDNFQLVNSIRDLCFHLIQRIFTTKPQGRELWAIQLCEQPDQIVSDCEELNKSLIIAVAMADQASHSDNRFEKLLGDILRRTPLTFPYQTLQRLPDSMRIFLEQNQVAQTIPNLAQVVTNELRNFQSLIRNEAECIQRFVDPNATPVFLCILWKLLEPMWTSQQNTNLPAAFYKILQQMDPKTFSNHLRTFTDFIMDEINRNQEEVHKYIQYLLHLIWDKHVISFDQFIHVLVLRPCERPDTLIVVQLLLLNDKADGSENPFLQRVQLLNSFPIDHFLHQDHFRHHMNYHHQFPESFNFEILATKVQPPQEPAVNPLPVYFGNVCFRMLPVIDLFVHRYLEMELAGIETPPGGLENILNRFVSLYRFHHQPLTFVYQTLYCFTQLPALKKRLLAMKITQEFAQVRPKHWALSEQYLSVSDDHFEQWEPDRAYWTNILGRLVERVDAIGPDRDFDALNLDWRYMEFTNSINLTVFASCIELMTLPLPIGTVTQRLINVIVMPDSPVSVEEIPKWFNSFGMILAYLPSDYTAVLNQTILNALNSPEILETVITKEYPFEVFAFCPEEQRNCDNYIGRIITCVHAVWSHMAISQLTPLPTFLRNDVRPILRTEMQLLFVFHLISPFLMRLEKERTRILADVVVGLYELILQIGQQVELVHIDAIADLLYHIKYKHVGEHVRNQVREIIPRFPEQLRDRLKFMYTRSQHAHE